MSIVIKAPSGGGSISLDTQQSVTGDHTLQLPTGVGSANQVLRNGSTPGTLEFGADVTGNDYNAASGSFSGNSVTITGISASAFKIVVNYDNVSWDTNSTTLSVRLGTSSGIDSSTNYVTRNGYFGGSTLVTNDNDLFRLNHGFQGSSNTLVGSLVFNKIAANHWLGSVLQFSGAHNDFIQVTVGEIDLGATLDRLQFKLSGSATFDSGVYNVNVFTE